MAPSISTGLRSLSGPSAGDSRTIAADEETVARPLPWATQGWRTAGQQRGTKRLKGVGGAAAVSRTIRQVASYHLYPDVSGEGLLSFILGYRRELGYTFLPEVPMSPPDTDRTKRPRSPRGFMNPVLPNVGPSAVPSARVRS